MPSSTLTDNAKKRLQSIDDMFKLKKNEIFVEGLEQCVLLAALWNNIRPNPPQSIMDVIQLKKPMTPERAQKVLDELYKTSGTPYIDYIDGKPIKMMFGNPIINCAAYNKEYGENAAERIVGKLQDELIQETEKQIVEKKQKKRSIMSKI